MQNHIHSTVVLRTLLTFSLILNTPRTHASDQNKTLSVKNIIITGIGATGVYLGYHYLNTPEDCAPTLASIHPLSAVPVTKAPLTDVSLEEVNAYSPADPFCIQTPHCLYRFEVGAAACFQRTAADCSTDSNPLWVLASGWKTVYDQLSSSRRNASYTGLRRYLRRNIFHGPSITFDYPDSRRTFNFGQSLDQQAFDILYRTTTGHDVVLYGLCRGALMLLGWLENFENNNTIKAVLLESPALSLKDICQTFGQRYGQWGQGSVLHALLKTYFPHYNSTITSILDSISILHLAPNVPLFIGHIKGDQITTDEKVTQLVTTLRATRSNPVYFFVCDEPLEHGKLSRSMAYQQTINAFLKLYGLPHNKELAEQGTELLIKSRERSSIL